MPTIHYEYGKMHAHYVGRVGTPVHHDDVRVQVLSANYIVMKRDQNHREVPFITRNMLVRRLLPEDPFVRDHPSEFGLGWFIVHEPLNDDRARRKKGLFVVTPTLYEVNTARTLVGPTAVKERKTKKKLTPDDLEIQRRKEVKAAKELMHREKTAEVITLLREKLPVDRPIKFANKAHLTLRLYHFLLSETESAYTAHNDKINAMKSQSSENENKKSERFKGRLFNLLPMKNGFTTSYIPISSMFFFDIVKRMRLSTHTGDGRGLSSCEKMDLWSTFCCTRLVETKNRKFDGSFMTDGYAVSVLVTSKQIIDSRRGSGESDVESINKAVQHAIDSNILMVVHGGVDPGFDDVVTASFSDGRTVSFQ